MNRLVLFDFDGTITTKDSFLKFLKFSASPNLFYLKLLLAFPYYFMYMLGIYDEKKSKEKILNVFIKNKSKEELIRMGNLFIDKLIKTKIVKPQFIDLIEEYKREKCEIAIVSASFDIWICPFCEKFNLVAICTKLKYDKSNIFIGEIEGKNCKGIEKKLKILNTFDLTKYAEIIAYGDSVGDNEMMDLATTKNWV